MNGKSGDVFNYKNLINKLDLIDKRISDKIHSMELPPSKEKLIYLSARLFNPDFITCYFLLILASKYFISNDSLFVIKPLIHTLTLLILTLLIKKVTARPRPTPKKEAKRLYDLRKYEKNCSMPSGDSLQSANFAIILLFYFNSFLGFFILPFVMFARIYYFCHYLFDTVVGSVMGILFSYLIYITIN